MEANPFKSAKRKPVMGRKIAVFTDTYLPQVNGVVTYLFDSLRMLAKNNSIVLFAPGEGKFHSEDVGPNFRIHWIPSAPFPFYEGYRMAFVDYARINNILKEEKPDIIHIHAPVNLGLQGIIAGRKRKIPIVITYHTHFPDYFPHLFNGKLPKVLGGISGYTVKKIIKHTFKKADIVTAPSKELVRELEGYGLHNVVYLPNGVDLSRVRASKIERDNFLKSHKIPSGKKVILYLGRISFEKRIEYLLEAFRLIEQKDRFLVIAGGGPYVKNFRELAAKMGIKNVVFTDFVKNIGAAYSCGTIFASASDSETFGLTFVEAMHMGLPVIGVAKFGANEVIKSGSGLLVQPGSVGELADAMEKLLKNEPLRKKMAKEAKKTAKEYSIEKSIKHTWDIYERLIRENQN